MEIHSFRRVFELERRIYRIDRLRLNPGGVPVRGLVYFAATALACVLAARIPLVGSAFSLAPWYLRDLVLPAMGAALLASLRIDGRPGHLTALAIARYWIGPRLLVGGRSRTPDPQRWSPGDVVLIPDGADGSVRRVRYRGPGAATIAIEHERGVAVRRWRPPRRAARVALAAEPYPRRPRSRRIVLLTGRSRLDLAPRRASGPR